MKKEDLQQKVIMYQILQKQLEAMKEQATNIEKFFFEIETTKSVIDTVSEKKNNDMLVSLGSGCFSDAKSINTEKILVDIGSGAFLRKSPEEAKKVMDERKGMIEDQAQELTERMNEIISKMTEIAHELEHAEKK